MTESSWEATRKNEQKKFQTLFLIFVPLVLLIVILVVNNRDLIVKSPKTTPVHTQNDTHPTSPVDTPIIDSLQFTEKSPPKAVTPLMKKKQLPSSINSANSAVAPPIREEETAKKQTEPLPVPPRQKESTVQNYSEKLFSELLPPITCFIQNRKDIEIRLSLELFFKDDQTRATLETHRDALKIVIMKIVQTLDTKNMTISTLEVQLSEEMNALFGRQIINNVQVKTIQLEKAKP